MIFCGVSHGEWGLVQTALVLMELVQMVLVLRESAQRPMVLRESLQMASRLRETVQTVRVSFVQPALQLQDWEMKEPSRDQKFLGL